MNKKIRILSLDGGGIRGIISCVILKYIEEQLQKLDNPNAKIGDYFDLIAGSSTGGLITALLLFPDGNKQAKFSVEEALNLYAKKGEDIFNVPFFQYLLNPFGLLKEKISDHNIEKHLLQGSQLTKTATCSLTRKNTQTLNKFKIKNISGFILTKIY